MSTSSLWLPRREVLAAWGAWSRLSLFHASRPVPTLLATSTDTSALRWPRRFWDPVTPFRNPNKRANNVVSAGRRCLRCCPVSAHAASSRWAMPMMGRWRPGPGLATRCRNELHSRSDAAMDVGVRLGDLDVAPDAAQAHVALNSVPSVPGARPPRPSPPQSEQGVGRVGPPSRCRPLRGCRRRGQAGHRPP